MGLRKVHNIYQLTKAVKQLIKLYDQELIIEKYINGPDVLSFVIGTGDNTKVCPLVEVTGNSGEHLNLWDTEKKLLMNSKYINARLSGHTAEIIKKQSKLFHRALQLYDIARIDWRIDKEGTPFFLESTPLPSLGKDFDCCAKLMGLNFHQLVGIVVNLSLKRLQLI